MSIENAACEKSDIESATYEPYWGFQRRPFENVPAPTFYGPSVKHEAAMACMRYGIQARKGILMLTGEIGSGKSLSSRAVILKLPRTQYEVGLLSNPTVPVHRGSTGCRGLYVADIFVSRDFRSVSTDRWSLSFD